MSTAYVNPFDAGAFFDNIEPDHSKTEERPHFHEALRALGGIASVLSRFLAWLEAGELSENVVRLPMSHWSKIVQRDSRCDIR